MLNLPRIAMDHGERLHSLGYALATLGDLIGADGSEHHLSPQDINGLTHAVRALGGYAVAAGAALYEAGELAAGEGGAV
jgi:hypothetical protein